MARRRSPSTRAFLLDLAVRIAVAVVFLWLLSTGLLAGFANWVGHSVHVFATPSPSG